MYRQRIIPCLLLKGKGLVKTVKFKDPKYIGDPINAVKVFNDKGVDELVFLDIEASKTGKGINFDLLGKISAQSFMPLCYGGGIDSVKDAKKVLELGFEKVSINSAALANPQLIQDLSGVIGSQSVVVTIDVKRSAFGGYKVYDHAADKISSADPVSWAQEAEKLGAGEIIVNSADRDGTMKGYDIGLIEQVSKAVSIPVVALGGAGSLLDLSDAIKAGASAVAAGSLFVFYGPYRAVLINYPDEQDISDLKL